MSRIILAMEAAESTKVRILGTKERILAAMYYAATGRTQDQSLGSDNLPNLYTHPPKRALRYTLFSTEQTCGQFG